MADIFDSIVSQQEALQSKAGEQATNLGGAEPAEHKPEILLIGCVDARLDPIADIGIPRGKALIYRNIAALVAKKANADGGLSVAAALEFAVGSMQVKDIIVMGHTSCGGIRAFVQGDHENTHYIRDYLQPLESVRQKAIQLGETPDEQAADMEKAAVAMSLDNLMEYDVVVSAVNEGRLQLHGWLIDTASQLIWKMDKKTGGFSLISKGDGGY